MIKKSAKRLLFFASFIALLGFGIAGYVVYKIPSEAEIRGCLVTTMYGVHLCPGSKDYVPLNKISKYLQKTLILAEDSTFFNHKGIDWESVEKSARENWEKGKFKRGGSTISQQLAKNMFLTKDKSLFRKFLEALITIKIEKTLKKNEILERYLNVVEFGKNLYGIKAASQRYFKKSPAEISIVEASFLTMLLPNPIKYAQSFYKKELTKFARGRVRRIVNDMYQYNRISLEEYNNASSEIDYFLSGARPPDPSPVTNSLDFEEGSGFGEPSPLGSEKNAESKSLPAKDSSKNSPKAAAPEAPDELNFGDPTQE